jgi:hypothetical protein
MSFDDVVNAEFIWNESGVAARFTHLNEDSWEETTTTLTGDEAAFAFLEWKNFIQAEMEEWESSDYEQNELRVFVPPDIIQKISGC